MKIPKNYYKVRADRHIDWQKTPAIIKKVNMKIKIHTMQWWYVKGVDGDEQNKEQ